MDEIQKVLVKAGRKDLIGYSKNCLITPDSSNINKKRGANKKHAGKFD